MPRRHPQVANFDEVEPSQMPSSGSFRCVDRWVGRAAGSQQLGCSFYEVAPGDTAFPFHWHAANEEAILVLSGTGTLRLGDGTVEVRGGDYIAFPTGPASAHQLMATGTEALRYWCVSTMLDPEIAGYPDSRKIGAMSRKAGVRKIFFEEETREYFEREPKAGK